jgi:hypothetical protein
MTARMYWRWPLSVTGSMKSQAGGASACERRKSAHVLDARSGAGSRPACLRIPDRGRCDLDAECGEFTVRPPIAPAIPAYASLAVAPNVAGDRFAPP